MIRIVVPLLPPSVNHYKVPSVRCGRIHWRVTAEGRAYKAAVKVLARGETLVPAQATKHGLSRLRYRLTVVVVLGPKDRGDGDNFWKCVADGLVDAGVIHSDARVKEWHLVVNDWERQDASSAAALDGARTEIVAEVML